MLGHAKWAISMNAFDTIHQLIEAEKHKICLGIVEMTVKSKIWLLILRLKLLAKKLWGRLLKQHFPEPFKRLQ